jgi:chromosome segregation ATPase
MDIAAAIKNAFREMIVPELDKIKADVSEIKAVQEVTNKRIDDISIHIADLSRRIDENNKRIDETNNRIDELKDRIEDKISETNDRLNRLYEVIVRRDEHKTLELKVIELERDVKEIKSKIAM